MGARPHAFSAATAARPGSINVGAWLRPIFCAAPALPMPVGGAAVGTSGAKALMVAPAVDLFGVTSRSSKRVQFVKR
jgi:hypothetical protein